MIALQQASAASARALTLAGGYLCLLPHCSRWLRIEGYHDEVLFEETEGYLIGGVLYLLGPEVIVVVVPAQSWDADTDGISCSGDVAVFALGVVLETENLASEHLRVHLAETSSCGCWCSVRNSRVPRRWAPVRW